MKRLPRRPPRVGPPQRGRSEAVPPFGQTSRCARPVVYQRPPTSGSFAVKTPHKSICDGIHPSFIRLYKRWPGLFKVLDRPWKWLLAFVVLILLAIWIGSLL